MEATEDYRDGRAVPELGTQNGWTGEPRPQGERIYPGFRLYARSLDHVMQLREAFAAQKLDVYTHAEEIEQVTALARALNLIFALICAATAIGFLASTASSVLAGIKRKERILGLLRLHEHLQPRAGRAHCRCRQKAGLRIAGCPCYRR